jgi:hypothetical protein
VLTRRRLAVVAAFVGFLSVLTGVPSAQAAANYNAHIVNPLYCIPQCSEPVVDVANWGKANGAPVQMYGWRTTGDITNQLWHVDNPGGWTTLRGVDSGKCLDESAQRNGAAVYIYTCHGGANQDWSYDVNSVGNIRLRNRADGRCLDIKDYNKNAGAALQVWDCSWAWNQAFGLNYT